MSQQVLIERFFETLMNGNRAAARQIVDDCICADVETQAIIENLFWPTYDMMEKLFRNDQLSTLSHNYATRLLRTLTDQMQMRLEQQPRNGKQIMMFSGPNEKHDLGAQMASDLLESHGYELYFAGGGVANDEIIDQIGLMQPYAVIMFTSSSSDLPHIRQLIDQLHDKGVCPGLQIVVGGGVFNRAEGLSEEIGADLWAKSPLELVQQMIAKPDQRMDENQRTVGRRRRQTQSAAA